MSQWNIHLALHVIWREVKRFIELLAHVITASLVVLCLTYFFYTCMIGKSSFVFVVISLFASQNKWRKERLGNVPSWGECSGVWLVAWGVALCGPRRDHGAGLTLGFPVMTSMNPRPHRHGE